MLYLNVMYLPLKSPLNIHSLESITLKFPIWLKCSNMVSPTTTPSNSSSSGPAPTSTPAYPPPPPFSGSSSPNGFSSTIWWQYQLNLRIYSQIGHIL